MGIKRFVHEGRVGLVVVSGGDWQVGLVGGVGEWGEVGEVSS